MDIMKADVISSPTKTAQLKRELNLHHKTSKFEKCNSMGDIVRLNLAMTLSLKETI